MITEEHAALVYAIGNAPFDRHEIDEKQRTAIHKDMRLRECPNSRLFSFTATLLVFASVMLSACGFSTSRLVAKGEEHLSKRKFHDALIQFRAAAESNENSAAAHWGMARALENLGQFNEALDELRKTVELDENNLYAKARLGNYFLLIKPPLVTEAESYQRQIIIKDPNFIEGHILQASILAVQDRPESEVVAKVEEAIAIDPSRTETYISLSRYYVTKEKYGEAEAALKRGIEASPMRALGIIEYGRFLNYANRSAEAEAQFARAVELEPLSIEAHEAFAQHFTIAKKYDRAEAEYRRLIEIQENSPESRLDLATFFEQTRRPAEAISVLNEIIAATPEYVRARYKLGQIYLAQKDPAKVNEQLDELFAINDNDVEALMLRSRLRIQESKPEQAVEDLSAVLKKFPSHRDALYLIGQAKLSIGQVDQARAFIADIERFHPNFLRVGLLKIQAETIEGKTDGSLKAATELLEKVRTAIPNADTGVVALHELQIRGLTAKGLANLELKKLPEAQADLENALRYAPDSSSALVNLAKLHTAKNELPKATELYERALGIDAQSFDAIAGMVNIMIRTGATAAAHSKISGLIDRNAGRADVLASLRYLNADVFSAEGNEAQREAELLAAIALDEDYLPAYSALASIYAGRNELDKAIAQFSQIIAKRPTASVHTMLGILEDARSNTAVAEEHYRKALSLDPDSAIAANNLAWMIAENQGNLDEALQLATASIAKGPDVAVYYDTLGWVYYRKGLYSSAAKQMRRAIELDEISGRKADPAFRERLGIILAATTERSSL